MIAKARKESKKKKIVNPCRVPLIFGRGEATSDSKAASYAVSRAAIFCEIGFILFEDSIRESTDFFCSSSRLFKKAIFFVLDVRRDESVLVSELDDEGTHDPSLDITFILGPFDFVIFVSITGTCNIFVNKFVIVGFVKPSL